MYISCISGEYSVLNRYHCFVSLGKSVCPVCELEVNANKINIHLDMCLKRKNREQK